MQINETIGILGFGVEGASSLKYLIREGFKKIVIMDKKEIQLPEIPKDISVQIFSGEDYLKGLNECDTVIRSAGIYPLSKELLDFQMQGKELTSQANIFFDSVETSHIIAVTGTLGKGSTVSMIEHILNCAKIKNAVGGNFGIPMLDLLSEDMDEQIFVLELSSFQLMTLGVSPSIGVVLKVTSEHLDWHRSVEEYRDAKTNLVRYQRKNDFCIYSSDETPSAEIAKNSSAQKLSFGKDKNATVQVLKDSFSIGKETLLLSDCKVKASYQLENMAAAALATLALGVDISLIFEALKSYQSLPLRMEFKGEFSGIEFYNDSYATRPDATIAAIESMTRPFTLILGGSEKNADFSLLFETCKKNALLKNIVFIGATAKRMEAEAKTYLNIPLEIFDTLELAFEKALKIGKGGAVLLSPACASFGLFKNYKVRGEVFNKLVQVFSEKSL